MTGQYWEADEGLVVLMCAYTTKFLEFQLRESGGGFMGELNADDPDIRKTERNGSVEMLPNGNELVRSAQFLVLGIDGDGFGDPDDLRYEEDSDEDSQAVEYSPGWSEDSASAERYVQPTDVGCAVETDLCAGKQRQRFVVQLHGRSAGRDG